MTAPVAPPVRAYPYYRCSECGEARYPVVFRGDREPSGPACPEHPAAEVLAWTRSLQSLAYLFAQRLAAGERMEALRAEVEEHAAARPDAAVALVLFERWGGLPERRLPARSGAVTPAGLYG